MFPQWREAARIQSDRFIFSIRIVTPDERPPTINHLSFDPIRCEHSTSRLCVLAGKSPPNHRAEFSRKGAKPQRSINAAALAGIRIRPHMVLFKPDFGPGSFPESGELMPETMNRLTLFNQLKYLSMTRTEEENRIAWIEGWKRYAELYDDLRKPAQDLERTILSLDEASRFALRRFPSRPTSGLVEMQRILAKAKK